MEPRSSASSRALVVDDHADSRAMLRASLELKGLRVSEAAWAEQALVLVDTAEVDIVITDVELRNGVRNGVWVLQRLRAMAHTAQIPVIAVTGHRSRECSYPESLL